jgi:hypothetical protein
LDTWLTRKDGFENVIGLLLRKVERAHRAWRLGKRSVCKLYLRVLGLENLIV